MLSALLACVRFLPLFACVLYLGSCHSTGRRESKSLSEDTANTIALGQGYDIETFQNLDICAVGTERIETQPKGDLSFQAIENWDTIRRDLGFENEADFALQLMKGSPKAKFIREARDTELSASYIISADYVSATKFLNGASVDPSLRARAMGKPEQRLDFRRHCGNRYVKEVDIGGRLRVLIKFRFSSRNVKEQFEFASAGGAGALPNINLEKMSLKDRENSQVQISIHQEGGDFASIGDFVSATDGVNCSLTHWDLCQKTIAAFLDWARNMSSKVSGPYARVIAYKTASYLDIELPAVSETIYDKMIASGQEIERQDYEVMRATLVLANRDNYGIDDKLLEIEAIKALLLRNIDKLNGNLKNCIELREDANRCLDIAGLKLEVYDPTRLALGGASIEGQLLGTGVGEEFFRFCKNFMTGMSGNKSAILDRLAISCDDAQTLAMAGNIERRSMPFGKNCEKGSVITGIRGGYAQDQMIGTMWIECTPLESVKAKINPVPQTEIKLFGYRGDFAWSCPLGYAAIGVKGSQGTAVHSLRLVCSNL